MLLRFGQEGDFEMRFDPLPQEMQIIVNNNNNDNNNFVNMFVGERW